MKYYAFKLFFNAPLHIGHGKNDTYDHSETTLHSDTIVSALFSTAIKWYGTAYTAQLTQFFNETCVSSAFPFMQNSLFFPKPFVKLNFENEGDIDNAFNKKLKKIEWIEKALFENVLAGNVLNKQSVLANTKKSYWSSAPMPSTPISSNTEQKLNKIDFDLGAAENPTPYYLERIYFGENCGLFFLLESNEPNKAKEILKLLRMLGDEGFGTDKHNGNGTFKVELLELELKTPKPSSNWLNLSLYCPSSNEIDNLDLKNSAYKLLKRGGYMAGSNAALSPFRKRSINMFCEGGVFSTSVKPSGKVVDLKPQLINEQITGAVHSVLRSGKTIALPINNAPL